MTKISNQYSLTNILTADLANSRLGINNVSPTVALDVTGAGKFSSSVTADFLVVGTTAASSGGLRLGTQVAIRARNVANTANIPLIESSATDKVSIDSGGAGTVLGGALSGTSATFSSTITSQVNGSTFGTASASGRAIIIQSGSTNQAILFKNSAGGDGTLYINGTSTSLDYNFNTYSVGDALVIKNSGNVGIGTSSPSQKLHISGTAANNIFLMQDTTGYAIHQLTNTGGNFYFAIDSSTGGAFGSGAYFRHLYSNGAYPIVMSTNDVERLRITSGGEICVGTTTAGFTAVGRGNITIGGPSTSILSLKPGSADGGYMYHASTSLSINNNSSGGIYMTALSAGVVLSNGATSWASSSDERLKNINSNIENAVDKLSSLRTVNFSWKSDETQKEVLGLIAQDVDKVFPQVVDKGKLPFDINGERTDETEYLNVRYTELIPVLVKAIQELSAKVSLLENK